MPAKKKSAIDDDANFNKIKEEVIILLTGQDESDRAKGIDYTRLAKRALIVLVAGYGIARFSLLRRLAFSIATAIVTRYLAERAADEFVPQTQLKLAKA